MEEAIGETKRRRAVQEAYNTDHGITPQTIIKAVEDMLVRQIQDREYAANTETAVLRAGLNLFVPAQRKKLIKALEGEMSGHADRLEYEEAAAIRDEIRAIKEQYGG
jgi:excinuclease ABC subunit B